MFWLARIGYWPLVSALAVLLVGAPALAEYRHRVVVIEPASEDGAAEVRARLRGELRAAGFDVIALPAPSSGAAREISETSARELHPAAVLFVASNTTAPSTGEIWLSDRLLRRTFVLKFSLSATAASRDAARVAVQAVEVLKADLAELSLTRPSPSPSPAPPAAPPIPEIEPPPPPPAASAAPARFQPRVEAAVGIFQGFSGLNGAITPVLRLGGRLPQPWFGERAPAVDVLASFAAFGGELRMRRPAGEARVKQTLGSLSVAARFGPDQVVQPFLLLSSGMYGVRVDGLAANGQSRAADTWSAVSGGGGGLLVQPVEGIALVLSGELLAAWSRTIVNIAEQRVASAGAPLLFLTTGVAGVF